MRPPVRTLALVLAAGALAGCGKDDSATRASASPSARPVSTADHRCREQWRALGDTLPAVAATGTTVRRVFASRWESLAAGVSYYAGAATGAQCGDLLTAEKATVTALTDLTARSLAYDVEQDLATALTIRATYAAAATPVPEPKRVRRAYRVLARQTPLALADLTPAFTELAAADPLDTAAVTQGLADLALLADTSDARARCRQALATIAAPGRPATNHQPG